MKKLDEIKILLDEAEDEIRNWTYDTEKGQQHEFLEDLRIFGTSKRNILDEIVKLQGNLTLLHLQRIEKDT